MAKLLHELEERAYVIPGLRIRALPTGDDRAFVISGGIEALGGRSIGVALARSQGPASPIGSQFCNNRPSACKQDHHIGTRQWDLSQSNVRLQEVARDPTLLTTVFAACPQVFLVGRGVAGPLS